MKIIAAVLFGILTGVVSAQCGLYAVDNPVKYLAINIPLCVLFVFLISFIPGE